jgi:hypothetical protein
MAILRIELQYDELSKFTGVHMKRRLLILSLGLVSALGGAALAADAAGRIYGRITTTDGDTYEGIIRWDKNEASWVDILDGTRERESSADDADTPRKKHRDRTRIEILGLKIGDDGDDVEFSSSSQAGIRIGHIKSIRPDGDDAADIILKSGRKVHMEADGSDLGSGIREIIVEDKHEGETELAWEDIELVEFLPAKVDAESMLGDRLYGTVTTRRGDQYTGFVAWDADEAFGTDVLDGETKDRTRKIRFDKIASIERYSSDGASITLKNGEQLVLRGTNDVNDGNRGIVVCDPAFGQVVVDWDQFEKLDFQTPTKQVGYDQFDGGRPLHGTVQTEEGDKYTGTIKWDDDESNTWEMINGEFRDVRFEIEFGLIKSIEKQSSSTSLVTVSDGRTFRLRGSNDVDESNRGIYIQMPNNKTVRVDWEDFTRLDLDQK